MEPIFKEYTEFNKREVRVGDYVQVSSNDVVDLGAEFDKINNNIPNSIDIKTEYESNPNTNAFTDDEKAKLEALNSDDYVKVIEFNNLSKEYIDLTYNTVQMEVEYEDTTTETFNILALK